MYEARLGRLLGLYVLLLACIGVQCFTLQVMGSGGHADKLEARLKRSLTIQPRRGDVLFADGTTMATDQPSYGVHVDLNRFDAARWTCSACALVHSRRRARPKRPGACIHCGEDDGFSLRSAQRTVRVPLDDSLLPRSTPWDCNHCGETNEVALVPVPTPRVCPQCESAGTLERLDRPTVGELARILGTDAETLHARMAKVRRQRRRRRALRLGLFQLHVLMPKVEREVGVAVALASEHFPGVVVEPVADRTLAPHAASIVGRLRQPGPDHFKVYADPSRADEGKHIYTEGEIYRTLFGRWGLEREFDEQLRGRPGLGERVRVGRGGKQRRFDVVREVCDGTPLRTTIVPEIQAVAHDLVQSADTAAAAVVMDVRTGAVLGIDSYARNTKRWYHAGYHHAVIHVPPGSVYKLVTALALLEAGRSRDETVLCEKRGTVRRGLRYHCEGLHGHIALDRAFAKSCNAYFMAEAGRVGVDGMMDAARRLGMERNWRLHLRGAPAGLESSPGIGRRFIENNIEYVGIGQGVAECSPIQIAVAYARLATGGRMVEPYLVEDGAPRTFDVDPVIARHASALHDAACLVVTEGTGRNFPELAAVRAAGKSGTAELVRREGDPGGGEPEPSKFVNNAWFVGYAPHDDPRYVAVFVHERVLGHGAELSARPAAALLQAALDLEARDDR